MKKLIVYWGVQNSLQGFFFSSPLHCKRNYKKFCWRAGRVMLKENSLQFSSGIREKLFACTANIINLPVHTLHPYLCGAIFFTPWVFLLMVWFYFVAVAAAADSFVLFYFNFLFKRSWIFFFTLSTWKFNFRAYFSRSS